jgi:predicted adenylyl cyclase CyaB
MIEVEVRTFLTKNQYNRLKKFFKKNAKLVEKSHQETIYFDTKQDFRIQKSGTYSKIWMKGGKMHDEKRDELEIKFAKEDFGPMLKLLNKLGLKNSIKWLRERNTFLWNGINVMLDNTIGYGYILELEKLSDSKHKDKALKELKVLMNFLGLSPTPKEEFGKRYSYYKKHWRSLIK